MIRLALSVFLVVPFLASAQLDTTVFRAVKKIQTNEFVIDVPEQWRNMPYLNAGTKDQRFQFSEVSLPKLYNNTPVVAEFTLRVTDFQSRAAAEDYVITEFTSYPDRITSNYNYTVDSLVIASGETASLYHTRYYRRSKALNFTNYYLVAYSPKRKATYILTITFQYRDTSYAAEEAMKFKEYVLRVLKTLVLR